MFHVALSYEVAGSSGAGLSPVTSMLSVVPTTMGLPLSPLPPPVLPHPVITGVRTPSRAGSTRSLRFIVVVLLLSPHMYPCARAWDRTAELTTRAPVFRGTGKAGRGTRVQPPMPRRAVGRRYFQHIPRACSGDDTELGSDQHQQGAKLHLPESQQAQMSTLSEYACSKSAETERSAPPASGRRSGRGRVRSAPARGRPPPGSRPPPRTRHR